MKEIKKNRVNGKELYRLVVEHSEYSTIQGIHYIFLHSRGFVGKVFWALVVLGLFTLGTYWSVKAYNDWQENLVLTTVKSTAYPISGIEFPAVTICGPGHICCGAVLCEVER